MRAIVTCRCAVAGCTETVRLVPFAMISDTLDLTEGMCRDCLRIASPDRRAVFRQVRLELRLALGMAQIVLFVRAWDALKMSAAERRRSRWAA